eukprot:171266_1
MITISTLIMTTQSRVLMLTSWLPVSYQTPKNPKTENDSEIESTAALSVSSKTILTPQDDDIPVPAQKSSPKRSWIHTLVLWLYPAFSYFAVMAVFITMMRALTRRHAAQFLASVSAGSAPAPPLEDLLLPNFSADYANIFDSL